MTDQTDSTTARFQVVRYTPSGHRFPWCAPVDTWAEANELAIRSREAAYGAAFALGGEALYEPIRIVVERI